MTIGIAARGADAGRAILSGLAAVEAVGTGEIRGFGVFRAIAPDGSLIDAETQDGGGASLRESLERRGLLARAEAATVAALISSGPNRPEPLVQFLAGSAAGLVTGHRRPDLAGDEGVAMNRAALARLESGDSPEAAVAAITTANPEIDAGLIAVTAGGLALAETARVRRRTDRGSARLVIRNGAAGVAVLHNAIQPFEGLAALAAGAARLVLEAALPPLPSFALSVGMALDLGTADGVWLDADGAPVRIASANPALASFQGWTSAPVYLGTPVHRDGPRVGVTVDEAYCRLDRGRIEAVTTEHRTVHWMPD